MVSIAEIASAFVTLVPSMRGFGAGVEKQVGPVGKSAGLTFGKLFAAGAALGLGTKVLSFLGDSIGEAREAQKVSALVANAIKATGGAANVTTKQVDTLATSISNKTGIDDEQIASGSALLLTFKNVANQAGAGGKIFDRATQSAVDLSAAGFGSIDSASKQLGKALNDPIKGISALTRSGVTFTAAQQEQIKAMVTGGDLLGAQKVLLKEVEGQVGGAAAATTTSAMKASVAFGNLKEQIGTALLPTVDRIASTFSTKVVPAISGFITQMQTGVGVGGQVVAVVKSLGAGLLDLGGFLNNNRAIIVGVVSGLVAWKSAVIAFNLVQSVQLFQLKAATIGTLEYSVVSKIAAIGSKAFAVAQGALNLVLAANPIGLVVAGLVALGVGLVIAYKKSETFRAIVDGAFSAVRVVVSSVVGFLSGFVPKAFATISEGIRSNVGSARGAVSSGFGVIRSVVQNVGDFIAGAVKFFSTFTDGVRGQIGAARSAVSSGLDAVRGSVRSVGEFVAGAVSFFAKFTDGVRDKVSTAVDFVRGIPGQAKTALGNLGSTLTSAGADLIQGLIDGVTSKINALKEKLSSLTNLIPKVKGPPSRDKVLLKPAGQLIMEGFIAGIESQERALISTLRGVTNTVRSEVAGGLATGDFGGVRMASPNLSGLNAASAGSADGAGRAASGSTYQFYTFDLDGAVKDARRREAFAGAAG